MEDEINLWLIGGGLFIGILFGSLIQRSKFCMAAAVSNLVLMRDFRQLHAYLAAVAVAIFGTQLLELSGLVNIGATGYRSSQINLLGASLGGLSFGFGTMLAGGCVGRTIVRVGEGNLGALIALVVAAITAALTMYGFIEPLRIGMRAAGTYQLSSETGSIAGLLNLSTGTTAAILVSLCLFTMFFVGRRASNRALIMTGAGIGLLVVASWVVTGYFSQDEFSVHRPASLTYAGPLANVTMVASTGQVPGIGTHFGISLLLGTMLGAILAAGVSHSFRWHLPDTKHLLHLVVGGMLMGFGAITAGGCNIGQGITGISTCSLQPVIALIFIAMGMWLGVHWLLKTELRDPSSPRPTLFRVLHLTH